MQRICHFFTKITQVRRNELYLITLTYKYQKNKAIAPLTKSNHFIFPDYFT